MIPCFITDKFWREGGYLYFSNILHGSYLNRGLFRILFFYDATFLPDARGDILFYSVSRCNGFIDLTFKL